MGTRGLRVYRVHGIYYKTFLGWDAYPTGAGKEIVQEIPTDPEALKGMCYPPNTLSDANDACPVWIAEKIRHYEEEKAMWDLKADDNSNEDDGDLGWGVVDVKPTPFEPRGDLHLEWVYIVDLDDSRFTITSSSGWSRHFKLGNLPHHLFDDDLSEGEVLTTPVELECLYTDTTAMASYDAIQLARFAKHASLLSRIDTPQGYPPVVTSEDLDSWKPLTQLLLAKFLERYLACFKDLAGPESAVIFDSTGLDTNTAPVYLYKRLAYGIINLCDSPKRIKFRKGLCDYIAPSKHHQSQPTWECPQRNVYWIGEVLVILEPRIHVLEFLHAAIGKALDLLGRPKAGTSETRRAVIFSIQALVIVTVNYRGLDEPEITYSQNLPVITPSDCNWYRCFGGLYEEPTAGIGALMDVFARERETYSLPAGLPFEICTEIYNLSNLATRESLAVSCRAFRAIQTIHPRIGQWDLLHAWNHGNVGFVASEGPGLTHSVVSVEECQSRRTGFRVGLFRGAQHIDLNLPWVAVVKLQNEGYDGCRCCAGLPIRGAKPAMLGRVIRMEQYEEERQAAGYHF